MFKIFNKNERNLKKLKKILSLIKKEEKFEKSTQEELKNRLQELKNSNLTTKELLPEVFAIVKEATKRTLGFNTFDVQLMGGIALDDCNIAEMRTGEGKTLVAVAPAILNSLKGKVHVVTVNDYLAKRDFEIMEPIYEYLGVKATYVISTTPNKKEAYENDVVYVTNSELAFDYLRDNLVFNINERTLNNKADYVIIDEADSILIDDARNPLIISGQVSNHNHQLYYIANEVSKKLIKGEEIKDQHNRLIEQTEDFVIIEKTKTAIITEQGMTKIEEILGITNLYEAEHVILAHMINNALLANYVYKKDVSYLIKNNEIHIIDENTGRVSEGRRFSEGIHQAIESKEELEVNPESQTIASTSYQNFFKRYKKIAGMTGTAQTEATEFNAIYNLDVITIPTNNPIRRKDLKDLIYFSEKRKLEALVEKVKEIHKSGQPILIGTTSVDKSEQLHELFLKENIKHEILNAKNHEREAHIIEKAGELNAITISTNMAGRGVDIKIPKESLDLGGLYIIGSERHPSRRIDNQLRGRSGRQGDIGTTQFYLSLEDELLVTFSGDKIKSLIKVLNLSEDDNIESGMVSKAVENAQKQMEEANFEYRKHLIEYDNVNNDQRKVIYDIRENILNNKFDINEKTKEYISLVSKIIVDEINEMGYDNDEEKEKLYLAGLTINKYNINTLEYLSSIEKGYFEENKEKIIKEIFETVLEEKRKSVMLSEEDFNDIKKQILLQTLDKEWKEHLHQLDVLSTGIGLRGYNQKDPLTEYKKESYHLFEHLIKSIKVEYVTILNKLAFQIQPVTTVEE